MTRTSAQKVLSCTLILLASIGTLWRYYLHQKNTVLNNICTPNNTNFFQADLSGSFRRVFLNKKRDRLLPPLATHQMQHLYFIHIPKNAGTSVYKAFNIKSTAKNFKTYRQEHNCYLLADLDHMTPQHSIDLKLNHKDQYLKHTTFAIVRHPYSRFVSSYTYFKERNIIPENSNIDDLLDTYENINTAIQANQFIPSKITEHATAQSRFIFFTDGNRAVKEILHFESLNHDWEKLSQNYPQFQLPKELPHTNKSGNGKTKVTLTTEQKKRIYSIYKDDFVNFGYTP